MLDAAPPTDTRPPARSRRKPAVIQRDVERAIKAAKSTCGEDWAVRLDLPGGATITISSALPAVAASPDKPLDEWMAKRARRA